MDDLKIQQRSLSARDYLFSDGVIFCTHNPAEMFVLILQRFTGLKGYIMQKCSAISCLIWESLYAHHQ